MLDYNFSNHIEQESKNCDGILNEMQNLIFFKLCNSVLSFPVYKLSSEKFGIHSLSLLHKTASGNIEKAAVTTAWTQQRRISEDVILILDEIYLQKFEEYFGGHAFRTNEDGDLYKGMLCFMIVGLKYSFLYVIKSVPEKEPSGQFNKDHLIECLKILHGLKFIVLGFVCDDHASNVSAYTKLLSDYNDNLLIHLIFT